MRNGRPPSWGKNVRIFFVVIYLLPGKIKMSPENQWFGKCICY